MSKFCSACGATLNEGVRFCPGCGAAAGGGTALGGGGGRNNNAILLAIAAATAFLGVGLFFLIKSPSAPVVTPAGTTTAPTTTPTTAAPATTAPATAGNSVIPPTTVVQATPKVVVVKVRDPANDPKAALPADWFRNYRDQVMSGYVTLYTTGPARVRQFPTTRGGAVNGTLRAGSEVSGVWVRGADSTTRWLRTDGYPAGYVWEGNLR